MTFADATSVSRIDNGHYTGEIHSGWDIMEITNGGYLMAMVGRAMTEGSDGRRVVSLTGHFMNPGGAGPAEIEVEHLKTGRNFTTARALLSSAGKPLVSVTRSLANPGPTATAASLLAGSRPSLPEPEDCARAVSSDSAPFPPPIVDRVDLRLHPDDAGGALGRPTGEAVFRGWFRLLDGEPIDELAPGPDIGHLPPGDLQHRSPDDLDSDARSDGPYPQPWSPRVARTQIPDPFRDRRLSGRRR